MGGGIYKVIYTLVQAVPFGQVATYGQIAGLAGCGARQVGYAMAAVKAMVARRALNRRVMRIS